MGRTDTSSLMLHPQPWLAPSLRPAPAKQSNNLLVSHHGILTSLGQGGQTTEHQGKHQEPLEGGVEQTVERKRVGWIIGSLSSDWLQSSFSREGLFYHFCIFIVPLRLFS